MHLVVVPQCWGHHVAMMCAPRLILLQVHLNLLANVVCRGSVPPGARFDPFGPIPPGGSRGDTRSGRFAGYDFELEVHKFVFIFFFGSILH